VRSDELLNCWPGFIDSTVHNSNDHLIAIFDSTYTSERIYLELRKKMDEPINKLNAFYKYQAGLKVNLGTDYFLSFYSFSIVSDRPNYSPTL